MGHSRFYAGALLRLLTRHIPAQNLERKTVVNKLAKARKMRKPPGTLGLKSLGRVSFGLKKFGPNILRKLKKK